MAEVPLMKSISKFTSQPNLPTVLLFGTRGTEMGERNLKHMCNLAEHNDWYFSAVNIPNDLSNDPTIVNILPKIIHAAKLIIVDNVLSFDAGMLCGASTNTPCILYCASNAVHSPLLKWVSGVCYSLTDLSLFFDTYNDKEYMSETHAKIQSTLTVLSNMRFGTPPLDRSEDS